MTPPMCVYVCFVVHISRCTGPNDQQSCYIQLEGKLQLYPCLVTKLFHYNFKLAFDKNDALGLLWLVAVQCWDVITAIYLSEFLLCIFATSLQYVCACTYLHADYIVLSDHCLRSTQCWFTCCYPRWHRLTSLRITQS